MLELPAWLRLILAALACYRLATLIVFDEGPAGIFDKLRETMGAYDYGPEKDNHGDPMPSTNLGRLFVCPHCIGVWMAAFCAALYLWVNPVTTLCLLVLGIAGAQSRLQGRRE